MHAFCYIMQLAGFSSRRLYPSIPLTTTTHLDCAPTSSPPSQVSLSGCLHSARVIAGSAMSQLRAPVHLQEASAAVCSTLHMVQAALWQRRLQPVPSLLQPGALGWHNLARPQLRQPSYPGRKLQQYHQPPTTSNPLRAWPHPAIQPQLWVWAVPGLEWGGANAYEFYGKYKNIIKFRLESLAICHRYTCIFHHHHASLLIQQ